MVVLDDGAAAQGEGAHHVRQLPGAPAEGLYGGHEDGAALYAAELADAALAELWPVEGAEEGFRQVEGHESDARQEADVSEEHVQKFREVALHRFRQVGYVHVPHAGGGFFDVFHVAHDAVFDPRAGDERLRAFHGLLVGDLPRPFFHFRVVFRFHPVGGGEAGFFL